MSDKKTGKATTAAELADKERQAREAEAHRMEQEAADLKFRAEQQGRAAVVGQQLLAEVTGGMTAAVAVGWAVWHYLNAELLRGTPGDTARFAAAVKQLKVDVKARLVLDTDPNISRYLGLIGLCRVWGEGRVAQLPKAIAQEAMPMITRDDTAPGLDYTEDTPRGKEERCAYSWVMGCEEKGPALLQRVIDGQGTCGAVTLVDFGTARKAFCAAGRGRHNQGGKNQGGKGKGGKAAADKAAAQAAGKLAQGIAAIKAYAASEGVPFRARLKGLATVVATVRTLKEELAAASKPAAEAVAPAPAEAAKGRKGKGGKPAAEAVATAA